ncbi:hypothetical protein [Pedobacter xixiisoli]|uniref:Uncharacterized protein n=1 Tax=Pedobacter xixiisoli TaxID=1476464 RepID=A0A285ZPZ7_9SPHI|nr:hypothetical protein [Pedobacter xixiisoli]SOD11736.1 hypothetical protein SAMN06297358_0308 [Pedobacter xixiisoli]
MLKKCKYKIDQSEISVYPKYQLLIILAIIYVVLLIIPVGLILGMGGADIALTSILRFVGISALVTALIFGIPMLIFAKNYISFNLITSEVYRKGIFGSKRLMHFNEIDSIVHKNMATQMGYFISVKGDKFGKGVFLHSAVPQFVIEVLPALQNAISSSRRAVIEKQLDIAAGNFEYYTFKAGKYHVHTNPFRQFGLGLAVVSLFFCATVYYYFAGTVADSEEVKYMVISFCVLLLLVGLCSKQAHFDVQSKQLVFKFYGITFAKYSLSEFHNFSITRSTTNGMYNGTDVKLLFKENNGKTRQSFELRDFGKTKGIERFIDETEHIISSIG